MTIRTMRIRMMMVMLRMIKRGWSIKRYQVDRWVVAVLDSVLNSNRAPKLVWPNYDDDEISWWLLRSVDIAMMQCRWALRRKGGGGLKSLKLWSVRERSLQFLIIDDDDHCTVDLRYWNLFAVWSCTEESEWRSLKRAWRPEDDPIQDAPGAF